MKQKFKIGDTLGTRSGNIFVVRAINSTEYIIIPFNSRTLNNNNHYVKIKVADAHWWLIPPPKPQKKYDWKDILV